MGWEWLTGAVARGIRLMPWSTVAARTTATMEEAGLGRMTALVTDTTKEQLEEDSSGRGHGLPPALVAGGEPQEQEEPLPRESASLVVAPLVPPLASTGPGDAG